MALYEGLKSTQERPAEPSSRWKELRHERGQSPRRAGFLDNLLGQGSQAKVSQAMRASASRPVVKEKTEPRWRSTKVEAIGSGQTAVPRGKKGLGRSALIVMALGWGLFHLHPWHLSAGIPVRVKVIPIVRNNPSNDGGWSQDLASLFRPSNDGERAKVDFEKAAEARKKEAEDAIHLAALPVDPATGVALALWQDGAGHWWEVNAKAELRPSAGPAAKDSLGLPELRGVSAGAEEHGRGKRLCLRLPGGLLKALLPLEPSVASEVRAVLLDDPAQPALLTHDGTRCLLDATDWERRQRRLGLVLADLAAKKRRAALIDLRYEDTAVVRPAGRG